MTISHIGLLFCATL